VTFDILLVWSRSRKTGDVLFIDIHICVILKSVPGRFQETRGWRHPLFPELLFRIYDDIWPNSKYIGLFLSLLRTKICHTPIHPFSINLNPFL